MSWLVENRVQLIDCFRWHTHYFNVLHEIIMFKSIVIISAHCFTATSQVIPCENLGSRYSTLHSEKQNFWCNCGFKDVKFAFFKKGNHNVMKPQLYTIQIGRFLEKLDDSSVHHSSEPKKPTPIRGLVDAAQSFALTVPSSVLSARRCDFPGKENKSTHE